MELTKHLRQQIREIAKEGYGRGGFYTSNQFDQDFGNFFISKKMIARFIRTGSVNEKLLINNIVVLLNSFGIKRTNVILRAICDDVHFSVAKAILLFLRSYLEEIGGDVYPNRIMTDILKDITVRYNLEHL